MSMLKMFTAYSFLMLFENDKIYKVFVTDESIEKRKRTLPNFAVYVLLEDLLL